MAALGFPANALLLACLFAPGSHAVTYSSTSNLENYCDRTLYISCPYSYGEAGTIRFWIMPKTTCKVTVTLSSSNCGSYNEWFKFYLNIRESKMPTSSTMEIYDTSSSRTLGKTWNGGSYAATQYSNPTSAGQYLSRSARQPEVSIEFTPSRSYPPASSHQVVFDYVVVSDTSSSYNTYCSALSGYVSDNYICDTSNDRVNCPSSYSASVYSMDPAMYRQSCSLEGGAIAGIVIGCVAFVAIVIGIIVACANRRPRTTVTNKVAFTNNAYSAPVVTFSQPGAPAPYPTQAYAPAPYPAGAAPAPYPAGAAPVPYPAGGAPLPPAPQLVK
ncbi:uncharacterized protein LOC129595508 isoform X2 [Paramacrobiotus metropolitanus]|uniref:uncharacterized protein LOC129595508 isoform X2 n=1 Tax=Paramacrobiotus metropolitanus TaxID=2943436 RepID=UPI0024464E77|nr:uncharacterized protein LOC129595508 isoform X2 [Paramacrobiotus metropolitanus]